MTRPAPRIAPETAMTAMIALMLAAAGCAHRPGPARALPRGEVLRVRVEAPGLGQNVLGDPPSTEVIIYLPAGYSGSGARYPVLYLLHGFDGSPAQLFDGSLRGFDLAAEGPPYIVVAPSARNLYGGSFWLDSPVTGAWGTFLERDLPAWVDAHFRTIARADARGLAGVGMGGFAALAHGLARPDVFCGVYALSPWALGDMLARDVPQPPAWMAALQRAPAAAALDRAPPGTPGPTAAPLDPARREPLAPSGALDAAARAPVSGAQLDAADRARLLRAPSLALAVAAAFSPEPALPPLFADLAARSRWTFPLAMGNARKLRLIGLELAQKDPFAHVPETVQELYATLQETGAQVQLHELDGAPRDALGERLAVRVLPFFTFALSFRQ